MSAYAREDAELMMSYAIHNFAADVLDYDTLAEPDDAFNVAAGILRELIAVGWREPMTERGEIEAPEEEDE